ncbi:RT/endonuclease [Hexamita inflata]|uniref:RT/endonuclease n=1 Tax=Hexamita inflata TaxID=28002 RepID=A0AA86Q127_9EUKA|nr:RT/endonuclease [Hexamita inflata]
MFDSDSIEPRKHAHICPLCQKHITDPNHAIFCSSGAGYAIKRHNKAQYDLIEHLPSKYKPQLSPTYNQFGKTRKGNKDDPGDPPDEHNGRTPILKGNADISIEYQNKHYFWDLCICQNYSTMNREYKSKLETHTKNYKVPQDQILPLIISDNLTIHQESLTHIKKFIKNPQNLLNQIGKSILIADTQIELYLTTKKLNNTQETNKPQYNTTQKTITTTETLTTTKLWKQQYLNTRYEETQRNSLKKQKQKINKTHANEQSYSMTDNQKN